MCIYHPCSHIVQRISQKPLNRKAADEPTHIATPGYMYVYIYIYIYTCICLNHNININCMH